MYKPHNNLLIFYVFDVRTGVRRTKTPLIFDRNVLTKAIDWYIIISNLSGRNDQKYGRRRL